MSKIVIVGAGIGGIPMALEAKELLGKSHKITVISDSETFKFTPSNPWVAVNWRKKEQIEINLTKMFQKKGIEFITVAAKKIVADHNSIELIDGQIINYDYLVIATGPKLAFDEIEGLGPAYYSESICTTDHAAIAGHKWKSFLDDPGPIVVGAVQGASCFGPAYEYALMMNADLRKHKIRHKVPMTFITSEPYIGHLGLDGVGDTKSLLESKLRDANINWITNASIDKVKKNQVYVTEHSMEHDAKIHQPIKFKHAMFLPSFKGIDAVFGIEGLTNPKGFVVVDEYQRNPKYQNIFSVGVCVAIPPVGQTAVPVGVPKTGYMIESMVRATAHNIKSLIEGQEPKTKASLNAFCLADFGDGGVAFIAKPQIPPRNVNWSGSGKWVHLAKVAFEKYFLYKIKHGKSEPFWEKFILKRIGVEKLEK